MTPPHKSLDSFSSSPSIHRTSQRNFHSTTQHKKDNATLRFISNPSKYRYQSTIFLSRIELPIFQLHNFIVLSRPDFLTVGFSIIEKEDREARYPGTSIHANVGHSLSLATVLPTLEITAVPHPFRRYIPRPTTPGTTRHR